MATVGCFKARSRMRKNTSFAGWPAVNAIADVAGRPSSQHAILQDGAGPQRDANGW
jgi:hypothetical protein